MTADQIRAALVTLLLVALLGAGYWLGVKTSAPTPENIAPAAAQRQADGSVIPERRPVAGKPPPAPHVLPKGSTEERRVSITVQPRAGLKLPATAEQSSAVAECPPVTVDLSLVRQGDGRRVVASSPDGDVIGALDVPLEAGIMPTSRPWAAGMSCDPGKCRQTAGAWVERDLGRVRLGVEAARQQDGGVQARARVGWVW
jgi:hypothetical protein